METTRWLSALLLTPLLFSEAGAQVDSARADQFFREANQLCAWEGGRIWGISLCGPMVFADAASGTIATSQPAPDAPRPRALGYANTALQWGDSRWSTFVWALVPMGDEQRLVRGRLMIHELFHRVQPELKLLISSSPGENDHLDTAQGRYWIQLEWRALTRAAAAAGASNRDDREMRTAVADALAFRQQRRSLFPNSSETERIGEINEGLPQYTGTVVAFDTTAVAIADVIEQLETAPDKPSFVRTFPYPSGAAYGILLDLASPGWPRRIQATDDLGRMLQQALDVEPTAEVQAAAASYGGAELLAAEEHRAEEHAKRVAEYRRRFVEEPVLVVPRGRGAAFITTGITSIPEAGTIYPQFRVSGPWGSLEAEEVLMSPDSQTYSLPASGMVTEGAVVATATWKLTLAAGWGIRPGPRPGDFQVLAEAP